MPSYLYIGLIRLNALSCTPPTQDDNAEAFTDADFAAMDGPLGDDERGLLARPGDGKIEDDSDDEDDEVAHEADSDSEVELNFEGQCSG